MKLQITTAILGLGIALTIIYLVRRDHLHTRHVGWWLFNAVLIAVLGFFPGVVDILAGYLRVGYPPSLLFLLGIILLLVKMLSMDIQQSRQERHLRRLTQRLALLEAELQNRSTDQP